MKTLYDHIHGLTVDQRNAIALEVLLALSEGCVVTMACALTAERPVSVQVKFPGQECRYKSRSFKHDTMHAIPGYIKGLIKAEKERLQRNHL